MRIMKRLPIICTVLAAAFGQAPEASKPTPAPRPAVEVLDKQVHERDAEIARLTSLVQALREQMAALNAYFVASERVRHLDETAPPSGPPPNKGK